MLIRRAYTPLADMGFNYTGATQDESVTLSRAKKGECYVMVEDANMVGTITLYRHYPYYTGTEPWYSRPNVATCGQFAVEPSRQRCGFGSQLMTFIEQRTQELGATELALDTADSAEQLIRFYMKRNYRFIEYIQHKGKTYRSVVLSKALGSLSNASTGDITVREPTDADQAEADEVDRRATLELRNVYRPNAVAQRQRKTLSPDLTRLVAVLDARVVGTVEYYVAGDTIRLLSLAVYPDFRRCGVASTLLTRLEEIARECHCDSVTLYTVRETGNVEIFERLGFVVQSEEPSQLFESDLFSTVHEVCMTKHIP